MCDWEPALMLSITEPRAKKDYFCLECTKVITKGERYSYASYLSDGKWWSDKTCLPCAKLYAHWVSTSAGRCTAFGQLFESILEAAAGSGISVDPTGWEEERALVSDDLWERMIKSDAYWRDHYA